MSEIDIYQCLSFYLSTIGIGALEVSLAVFHRGPYEYDTNMNVNKAEGKGLSQKIISYLPNSFKNIYGLISSPLEHFIGGSGFILFEGSLLGITALSALSLMTDYLNTKDLLVPFLYSSAFYVGWELNNFIRDNKKRGLELGDILQGISDVGAIASAYMILNKTIELLYK